MLLSGIFLLAVAGGHGQTPDNGAYISRAKALLRHADNSALAGDFQRAKEVLVAGGKGGAHAALVEYYLGYADYRLGVVVYRMDKEKAIAYLDSAVGHLERAIEADGRCADAYALLSSCCGLKIAYAPYKAIVLGPRSSRAIEQAQELSPGNPRVALLQAIATYNTPPLFGGGKEKGFEGLKRAAGLFETWSQPDSLLPDWGRAEVYAWIGQAHLDRKESILARKAFEKALQIEPDYGWVKYKLLPKVTSQSGAQ
jgi:tetratricopeptide (TPR) repeat protein